MGGGLGGSRAGPGRVPGLVGEDRGGRDLADKLGLLSV